MSTSEPEASRLSDDLVTPDSLLHTCPSQVSPEDMVMAAGRDVTPANLEWAQRKLATEGPTAIEKLLP
jgi:hypothetical protein